MESENDSKFCKLSSLVGVTAAGAAISVLTTGTATAAPAWYKDPNSGTNIRTAAIATVEGRYSRGRLWDVRRCAVRLGTHTRTMDGLTTFAWKSTQPGTA